MPGIHLYFSYYSFYIECTEFAAIESTSIALFLSTAIAAAAIESLGVIDHSGSKH